MAGFIQNSDGTDSLLFEWNRFVYDSTLNANNYVPAGTDHLVSGFPEATEAANFSTAYIDEGPIYIAFNSLASPGINGRAVVELRRFYVDFLTAFNTDDINDHRTTEPDAAVEYVDGGFNGYVYVSDPGLTAGGDPLGVRIYDLVINSASNDTTRDHMMSLSINESGYLWTGRSWWAPLQINGCTDPTQFNYDPDANVDDGSCVPIVLGCTDPTAFNFEPAANTDDGSCVPIILGCTNPTAVNYDPAANTDDGSCDFGSAPVISSFSFTNPTICPGESTGLNWEVTYSPSSSGVNNIQGPGGVGVITTLANGNTSWGGDNVFPQNTPGDYTLTTTNAQGQTTFTITLVELENATAQFTDPPDNTEIIQGQSVNLIWTSSGSGVITEIDNDIGVVATNGSLLVSPLSTTTYTLTATGTCNVAIDTVTIVVFFSPIVTNNNNPGGIIYGDQFTLNYSYQYADISATIDITYTFDDGSISTDIINLLPTPPFGSDNYNATTTIPYGPTGPVEIEYVFTAVGSGGTAIDTMIITVDSPPAPTGTLTVSPTTICPGATGTISWSYNGIGIISAVLVGPSINLDISSTPTGSTTGPAGTYGLIVTNPGGQLSQIATIGLFEVTEVQFLNDPLANVVIFPNSYTLSWTTSGSGNTSSIDQGIGPVNNAGGITVFPSVTTTYTITTTGLCNVATDSYTVVVFYQPTITDLTTTTSVDYGDQFFIQYSYASADILVELEITYVYSDGTTTVVTENLPTTTQTGSATYNELSTIPYNDFGPDSVQLSLTVTGSAGSVVDTNSVSVNIDRIPSVLNIPVTDDRVKDENPVFAPVDLAVTDPFLIEGIDVPVEIKANKPIKVSNDGGVTFNDIRQI